MPAVLRCFAGFRRIGPGCGLLPTVTRAALRADGGARSLVIAARSPNLERVHVDLDAFGEAMPMACDIRRGSAANRRVGRVR